MTVGRTVWWGKDSAWWRREWIVELGEEFGPTGPAVIDWLSCEAKAQNANGFVRSGKKSIARGIFSDVVTVSHVLSRAVTLGLLEEYEESDGRFLCRISGWNADQRRAGDASRKADQRSRQPVNTGDLPSVVTVCPDESRSVTECPPTEQNRTEEKTSSHPSSTDEATREKARATDEDRRLCRLLAESVREHNPKAKVRSDWRWLKAMRLLRERDGNSPQEIETLIRWVFAAETSDAAFWATTIQSAAGLREHFGTVWGKMQAAQRKPAAARQESVAEYLQRKGAA